MNLTFYVGLKTQSNLLIKGIHFPLLNKKHLLSLSYRAKEIIIYCQSINSTMQMTTNLFQAIKCL